MNEHHRSIDGSALSPLDYAMGETSLEERLRVLKAFADPRRIELLQLLRYGELCATGLLKSLYVSQPTLSHHMKILIDSQIVEGREEGRKTFYTISHEGLARAIELLEELYTPLDRERYRSFFCKHLGDTCHSSEGLCPNSPNYEENKAERTQDHFSGK